MKTKNRFSKAFVVIVIVGIGLFQNINNQSFISQPLSIVTQEIENDISQGDTVRVDENKIYKFTKSLIKSSIQQLIYNL